jgi:hypothetical protein
MDRALAYGISAGIIGFGAWIFVAGLSSHAPAFWACVALIPIAIGLPSAFGDLDGSLMMSGHRPVTSSGYGNPLARILQQWRAFGLLLP